MLKSIKKSLVVVGLSLSMSTAAMAMDTVLYTKLANDTISEANGGFVSNINSLIKVQKQLVKLGKEGSEQYLKRHPEHADLLGLVIAEADNMMKMTLEEIEDQWHQGKFMKSKGYDLQSMDHFGELFSLMDSIIHPATSYIALNDYKRTRKDEYLARAAAELIEVVEHVAHIGKKGDGTQLSSN